MTTAILLRTELRLFLRNPAGAIWTAVLPLTAVVVLGLIPGLNRPVDSLDGLSFFDVYLPILMMFSVCMAVVSAMPPELATYRERGVLRRLSTTPVAPSRLLAAQAAVHVGIALVTSVVMLVVAVAFFSVAVPGQPVGLAVSLLLVAAAAAGIATCVAALAPNARIAGAIATTSFFPLMFLAGLWVPRAGMPRLLRTISDYSPLGAGVRAVQSSIGGQWPPTASLLVLLAYAVVLGAVGARAFRWQ